MRVFFETEQIKIYLHEMLTLIVARCVDKAIEQNGIVYLQQQLYDEIEMSTENAAFDIQTHYPNLNLSHSEILEIATSYFAQNSKRALCDYIQNKYNVFDINELEKIDVHDQNTLENEKWNPEVLREDVPNHLDEIVLTTQKKQSIAETMHILNKTMSQKNAEKKQKWWYWDGEIKDPWPDTKWKWFENLDGIEMYGTGGGTLDLGKRRGPNSEIITTYYMDEWVIPGGGGGKLKSWLHSVDYFKQGLKGVKTTIGSIKHWKNIGNMREEEIKIPSNWKVVKQFNYNSSDNWELIIYASERPISIDHKTTVNGRFPFVQLGSSLNKKTALQDSTDIVKSKNKNQGDYRDRRVDSVRIRLSKD